jgi:hypothetical protein
MIDLYILECSERQDALLRRIAAGERVNDIDLDWPNDAVGRCHPPLHPLHISSPVATRQKRGDHVGGDRPCSVNAL